MMMEDYRRSSVESLRDENQDKIAEQVADNTHLKVESFIKSWKKKSTIG